ncbi:MAG: SPASM domain-containing protein [Clostridia bacterium]|nr:SPASM domain-containing protein [Clostridia bacterium]
MPNKVFLEITNACNLSCSFCHGTRRKIRFMETDEFRRAAAEARGFGEYLYFHLMGEPLLHPMLGEFLSIAGELGFKVILTTNGTLLGRCEDVLLASPALFKISISLHSFEANGREVDFSTYLDGCFDFAAKAAEAGKIAVMRLWNRGGADELNRDIIDRMHEYFDNDESSPWREIYSGYKIRDKVFLEWGEKFDWPDEEGDVCSESHSCYGLRDQVGILSDGTVVPCCLDADGAISLGNVFEQPLDEILASSRAVALNKSFETRRITEKLCQRCGYAKLKGYGKR